MQINGTSSGPTMAASEPPEPPPRNPDRINASLNKLSDTKTTKSLDCSSSNTNDKLVNNNKPLKPILSLDNNITSAATTTAATIRNSTAATAAATTSHSPSAYLFNKRIDIHQAAVSGSSSPISSNGSSSNHTLTSPMMLDNHQQQHNQQQQQQLQHLQRYSNLNKSDSNNQLMHQQQQQQQQLQQQQHNGGQRVLVEQLINGSIGSNNASIATAVATNHNNALAADAFPKYLSTNNEQSICKKQGLYKIKVKKIKQKKKTFTRVHKQKKNTQLSQLRKSETRKKIGLKNVKYGCG